MAKYQETDCQLTLQEGLEEYLKLNATSLYDRPMSEDSMAFFRCHDVAHVVFACDISLINEAVVKTWTAFGTSLGFWKHIAAYSRQETNEIVKKIPVRAQCTIALRSIALMPRVIWRCRAMSKRWPWSEHEAYLDKKLADIRREFNIKPLVVT